MNKHHVNLDALFRAAKQGCDLCREICVDAERDTTRSASFDNPGIFELNRDSYIFYAIRHSTRQQGFHFQDPPKVVHSIAFSCGYMLAPRFETEFDIYVERDCNPTLARAISGRPSFATPFSDGCFALISTWMRECTELHKGYCPSQLVAPLPSRVLDVGMEGGSDRVFLKIADNAEIGAYFTLSHCVSLLLN